MKLDEAAAILGVSLEDITIDGLKQTYKKLAHAWDPSKVYETYRANFLIYIRFDWHPDNNSAKIKLLSRSICKSQRHTRKLIL